MLSWSGRVEMKCGWRQQQSAASNAVAVGAASSAIMLALALRAGCMTMGVTMKNDDGGVRWRWPVAMVMRRWRRW